MPTARRPKGKQTAPARKEYDRTHKSIEGSKAEMENPCRRMGHRGSKGTGGFGADREREISDEEMWRRFKELWAYADSLFAAAKY